MENNIAPQPSTEMTDKEILAEILANTRSSKNYLKWQLIITLALVVIPFIAVLVVLPMVLGGLSSYGDTSGLLQDLQ